MLGFFTLSLKKATPLLIGLIAFIFALSSFFDSASAEERVLDRFEIQTSNDNSVKVILYTNGRSAYHTEPQDKGFSLVLDNTRLSEASLKSGLPIVIDNKNQFIGRAVSAPDGKIKIIIPNLPVNQYSVSVLQKQSGSQQQKHAEPISVASTGKVFESQFEEAVSRFKKPNSPRHQRRWAAKKPANHSPSTRNISPAVSHGLPPRAPQNRASRYPASSPRPVAQRAVSPNYYFPQWEPQQSRLSTSRPGKNWVKATPIESYNALALKDESQELADEMLLTETKGENFSSPDRASSALAYLQLDPGYVDPQRLSENASLNASDANDSGFSFTALAQKVSSWLTKDISGVPFWAIVLATFFLGGIGLFALMGALLLARLFMNPKLLVQPAPVIMPNPAETGTTFQDPFYANKMAEVESESPLIPSDELPLNDDLDSVDELWNSEAEGENGSFETEQSQTVVFQDQAVINGSDYLIHSPSSVKEAIRNTAVLKFPSRKRA